MFCTLQYDSFSFNKTAKFYKYLMYMPDKATFQTFCLLFFCDVAVWYNNFTIIFSAVDTYRCSGKKEKREEEDISILSKFDI